MINKSKRIYFVFVTVPLQSYKSRYGISYFKEMGWETHIIDLSPIVNPAAYKIVKSGNVSGAEREIFFSKKEYTDYVRSVGAGAVFIITTDFTLDSYFIHKAISKKQFYGYLNRASTEVEVYEKSATEKMASMMSSFTLQHMKSSLFIRIPRKMFKMKRADFVVLGGTANKEVYLRLCFMDEHTIVRHIHSQDYEEYLTALEMREPLVHERYCVFLDQFLPHHPDGIGMGWRMDGERYYREMSDFFHAIEKKHALKVVIAAHPRSQYETHPEAFGDFLNIRFKTAELVKNAEFVIAHHSTSINYAVLFRKPLILAVNDEIDERDMIRTVTEKYADELRVEIVNVSHKVDLAKLNVNEFDAKKYEEFSAGYLKKPGTSEKRFCVQLFELVSSLAGA